MDLMFGVCARWTCSSLILTVSKHRASVKYDGNHQTPPSCLRADPKAIQSGGGMQLFWQR